MNATNIPQSSYQVHNKTLYCITENDLSQEYLLNGSKKHYPDKQIWEKWVASFEAHGIDNIRLRSKFRKNFTLEFSIVKKLLEDAEFLSFLRQVKVLSKENSFLAFLYKCKTGCRFIDLAEKFGGGKSFHSKLFLDLIDRLVYYFGRFIKIPTREQANYHKRLLKKYMVRESYLLEVFLAGTIVVHPNAYSSVLY